MSCFYFWGVINLPHIHTVFSCINFVWSLNVFLFYSSFFHKSSFQECILKNSSWVGVCSCYFQMTHCTFKWMPLFWGSSVLKFFTFLVALVSSHIKDDTGRVLQPFIFLNEYVLSTILVYWLSVGLFKNVLYLIIYLAALGLSCGTQDLRCSMWVLGP